MTFTKINTLWSLDDISDIYSICHEDKNVYNTRSGNSLKIQLDFHGYCVLHLSRKDPTKPSRSVFYHKILALAFIKNEPYDLIEHIDDNRLNNDISNLRFSNKRDNMLSAFRNGKVTTEPSRYEIKMKDGKIYTGTMKEIAQQSGIALGTLYDHLNYPDKVVTSRTKYYFDYIKEIHVGTERYHKHYRRLGLNI